ncbi:MAG: GNAT family N-acetyltransferase [Gammaproteobacteria bacterium]|nr:GNAT family N-acetyltransferase [Gammaproteobacteria bacterium]
MITVRKANKKDISGIMRVEQSWPEEERASQEKMESRLEKFSTGFIVAEADNTIVGTLTTCPMVYKMDQPGSFSTWNEVTGEGYLPPMQEPNHYNSLYIVSAGIDKMHRGKGIFELLIKNIVHVTTDLNYSFVTAGAVIPGYARYCNKYGHTDAKEYVFLKRGERFVDPFMELYRRLNFFVPDENHVIPNYYHDDASLHYAAVVVHKILKSM